MRILCTGAFGFIASHIAKHLDSVGYEVHIADRLSYAGKWRNVEPLLRRAKLWIGNLAEKEFCEKLASYGFDRIVHCASNTHVDRSIADPIQFTMDNVLGTNQLLHAFEPDRLSLVRPDRIIVYSTDEVYGPTPPGTAFDETAPFRPSNAYSASKVGIEGLASAYFTTFGMPICVVRPSNVYGRGQHPEKAIPRFTRQALKGTPLTVHNDGGGSRDWVHTSDHARAIEVLLEKGEPGQAYNLPRNDEHTDIVVASEICNILGFHDPRAVPGIQFVSGRPGHDRRYYLNGSKIRALGWTPSVLFKDGLRDAVEWTRDAGEDWWDHDYVQVGAMGEVG